AWAHAHLKRSEPAAGAKVAISPQMIRFWFSERPELAMTFISMKDANGKDFPLSPARSETADPLALSVRVSEILPPGRYAVSWRTAASDGHPSHGSFSFVVLEKASLPANSSMPHTIGSGDTAAASVVGGDNTEEADAASSVSNSLA